MPENDSTDVPGEKKAYPEFGNINKRKIISDVIVGLFAAVSIVRFMVSTLGINFADKYKDDIDCHYLQTGIETMFITFKGDKKVSNLVGHTTPKNNSLLSSTPYGMGPIPIEDAYAIDERLQVQYWKNVHSRRPYYDNSFNFDTDYEPIYRFGWETRKWFYDKHFEEVEELLYHAWMRSVAHQTKVSWSLARMIILDAWQNVDCN